MLGDVTSIEGTKKGDLDARIVAGDVAIESSEIGCGIGRH
jgi:hypothetical protein